MEPPKLLAAGSGGTDVDISTQRLTVGPWSTRVASLRSLATGEFSALIVVRKGVNLFLRGFDHGASVEVELWSGEPDVSDGLGVVIENYDLAGVARIPVCTCGERGCGNSGVQLAAQMPAGDVPRLVGVLRQLPDLEPLKQRQVEPRPDTWDGTFADSEPRP